VLATIPRAIENGESTGHRGAEWCIANGYTEIHLWGFDSVFQDTIASDTHEKIPEGPFTATNIPKWRVKWNDLEKLALSKGSRLIWHPTT
jgi:hypothetical protein